MKIYDIRSSVMEITYYCRAGYINIEQLAPTLGIGIEHLMRN